MSETIIKIEGLGKKYLMGEREPYYALRDRIAGLVNLKKPKKKKDFWALKDINLEIRRGETIGIIGRNGAGKSTLLKILSQITPPTRGKITLGGRVASLLEVGTGFNPELTGRENIYLNGAILGMKRKEISRKFDEIVKFSEIEKFLDTPVKRYSSGMYVRLAFAVAAHLEPEVLLVDEVLAVGDAEFQKKCLGKMGEVGEHGRTVIFVSHNMAAIRSLCDKVALIEKGGVKLFGPAEEVINEYLGEATKGSFNREWKEEKLAPQNSVAIIKRVTICDEKGSPIERIYTDTSFNIEIVYKVKRSEAMVGLNTIFYDNENNCIFASINNHEKNWYNKPMPEGIYKSVCTVPKNFLNNGFFNLSIMIFGKNYSDPVITGDVLSLEINDGREVRGDYYGPYLCRIRPIFAWETTKLEEKNDFQSI